MKIKTKFNTDLLKGLERKSTGKVVLLYSGGIDSTAAGILLKRQGYVIHPLFINYHQTALAAEKFLVEKLSSVLGFEKVTILETNLLNELTISKLLGKTATDDTSAWVPGRNTLFMIIAGIFAKQIDADGISLGYMLDDNFVFGDNDYYHHIGVEELLSKSFLQPMHVYMPTLNMHKKDLVKLLDEENVLKNTVSCWNAKIKKGKIIACSQCANCIERQNFEKTLHPH